MGRSRANDQHCPDFFIAKLGPPTHDTALAVYRKMVEKVRGRSSNVSVTHSDPKEWVYSSLRRIGVDRNHDVGIGGVRPHDPRSAIGWIG